MSLIHTMPGHLIRRLNQIAVSIFQERMETLGIDLTPVQFGALLVLSENPGIDQATLAGLIAHDRVTIGGVVDRLQAKGLIARTTSTTDRRARVLALTDAGTALLTRALPEVRALQSDILSGLTEGEAQTFLALASKLAKTGNDRSRAPMKPRAAG